MTSVAFVANFEKTFTFAAVARELLSTGAVSHVTWFSPSPRLTNQLTRLGFAGEDVIPLHLPPPADSTDFIWQLDDHVRPHEPSVLQAIEGDRVLRNRALEDSLRRLDYAARTVYRVVHEKKLSILFGESTWALEVCAAYCARAANIKYITPFSVRLPSDRFGFAEGPSLEALLPLSAADPESESVDAAVSRALEIADRSDPLWQHNARHWTASRPSLSLLAEKTMRAVRDSRNNVTQMNLREYVTSKNPHRARTQVAAALREMRLAISDPADVSHPFVLMPLQVQPEASVDVLAYWTRDQARTAHRIADALPGNTHLAVKEHTHQFGSRPSRFYARLQRHPKIFLVDAFASSRRWADAAQLVIASTGTMTLEVALRGGLSCVMAPTFFDQLPNVHRLGPATLPDLRSLLTHREAVSQCEIHNAYARVLEGSSPGLMSDVRSVASALDADNVRALASGFERFLRANID